MARKPRRKTETRTPVQILADRYIEEQNRRLGPIDRARTSGVAVEPRLIANACSNVEIRRELADGVSEPELKLHWYLDPELNLLMGHP